jgi:hypothetical protein
VLHLHKRHAGVDGQRAEHLLERLEPVRRSADADDRERATSRRRAGFVRGSCSAS